jgi:phosphate transport system permease protein
MNRKNTSKIALALIQGLSILTILILALILSYLVYRGLRSNNLNERQVIDEVNVTLPFDVYSNKYSKVEELDYFTFKKIIEGRTYSLRRVTSVNRDIKLYIDSSLISYLSDYFLVDESVLLDSSITQFDSSKIADDKTLLNDIKENEGAIVITTANTKLKGLNEVEVSDDVLVVNSKVTELYGNKRIGNLYEEEVEKLLDGQYKNWSELDGPSVDVHLVDSLDKVESVAGAIMIVDATSYQMAVDSQANIDLLKVFHKVSKKNLTWDYLVSQSEDEGKYGGISSIIINTLIMVLLTVLIATPISVAGAIYLVEYAKKGRISTLIKTGIDLLAAVPSIIFGLFGLLVFVQFFDLGFSLISGVLTLSLMILPTILRTSEEAIRSVSPSLKEASRGLGATKIETIIKIVIPSASRGITTGIILAIGRALGETAALIFTIGSSTSIASNLKSSSRVLAQHIYLIITEGGSIDEAFASALVLIVLVLIINSITKIIMRRK